MTTPPRVDAYEKLGAFYLGREHDLASGTTRDDLLLYDAKDLTTHAICVGMTGSGKTGLCVTLLEEAALDGIPAIVIDPKGDIANLLLTFPDLKPADFRPWVDDSTARRKGLTPDQYAAKQASLWRSGLASWGQDGERIRRFRDATDLQVYTPGSSSGRPLRVLRSLAAPSGALASDPDALRERVASAVSGLLALLGREADPVRSREHILLSTIINQSWAAGRSLDLASLIGSIQSPSIERIGVMDLESFFPAADRFELAMSLNGLLASPGFAAWMEGDPLDVDRLLYAEDGTPRISILSIAHLSDAERMFFVTVLLNEVVTWMRAQSGTSSLRALLYMDEVFGFFPPTANPPSKTPMLTLMKQARAYGLGVVLATQNPVDLDYKGLSNAGTWFLGRLQTERDKRRVLDGLEGASATTGAAFDRAAMEATLAGLGSRVFLMHNVHEDAPVVFHTRWAMSYLRGPLTRTQLRTLIGTSTTSDAAAPSTPPQPASPAPPKPKQADVTPPAIPPEANVRYMAVTRAVSRGEQLVYRPGLLATGSLHFVRVAAGIDEWHDHTRLTLLRKGHRGDPWSESVELEAAPDHDDTPDERGRFEQPPGPALNSKSYPKWSRAFVNSTYRAEERGILHCKSLKTYSTLGEGDRAFKIRLRDILRERRDLEMEKLRKRYGPKIATLQERIRKAEQRVEVQKSQYRQQGLSTAISLGTTVLGALFGRKGSAVSKAGTTMRRAGRTVGERGDISRAKETVEALHEKLEALEAEFQDELQETELEMTVDNLEISEITVRPRKGDLKVGDFGLVWVPFAVDDAGGSRPVCDWPSED